MNSVFKKLNLWGGEMIPGTNNILRLNMRLVKLDGLRGIFSLMVVMLHYPEEYLPQYIYNFFLIRESWSFVDFFFVLSGFVISYNYNSLTTKKEFISYLKKRFVRLYPLLFYTVILYMLVIGVLQDLINNRYVNWNNLFIETLEPLLFLNSTPLLGIGPGMNFPSWSISAEMVSYTVYGLVLIFFSKRTKIFYSIILTSLLLLFVYRNDLDITSDYGFLRGLYGFFCGVLVSFFYSKSKNSFTPLSEWITIFVIIFSLYIVNIDSSGNFSFLLPIIFGFSIYIFSLSKGVISRTLENTLFQFTGKISYSIYLNHYLVIIVFHKLIFKYLGFTNTHHVQILVLIITLVVICLYSWITYKLVELKGGRYLKKYLVPLKK